ncbi:FtsQ-type POTRA domain-containing protein [Agrococcus sp. 1P02AA]|uniref:cell division protein FtsQ/DivIB n=1 Tax=Agrococcus sp. 1P02AA TaxID=3132259 RepID=UPI0039A62E1A
MRRPEGFDRPADRDGDGRAEGADRGDDRARALAADVREVVTLDALRRRRERALEEEAERAAGVPTSARPEPRRWALSAYAGIDDEEPASGTDPGSDAAAAPRRGSEGAAHDAALVHEGLADAALVDPAAEPLAEGESHAQRVDRAWRRSQREQRRLDRAELADTRREARIAKRERVRRERAEVRRFTAERRRQLRTALLAAGGLVLALLVLVGLVWSPLMSVREVQVEGADRIDPAAVQEALADQVGQPIATVTEAGIAERLQAIPQIESFRVDVVPPSSVIVHLVERRPVAVVESGAGASVIDAAGVVLGSVDETTDALPRLTGVETGTEEFEAVATLLVSVPSEVLAATETIEAPTASDIRLTLDTGQQVQWGGADQSPLKADVLAALMSTQDPETARVLDVRAPEHPVVRGS